MPQPTCNICGGSAFIPGPGNRLSKSGQPPQCAACRSIERHRIGRAIVDRFRDRAEFMRYSLLVWGEPGTVARGWFTSAEQCRADQGDEDLARRPAGSIDFLLCANVLHHVDEPRRTIAQIARVVSDRGLAVIAYPNPLHRTKTNDWGWPDPARGGARRIIGRDFEEAYAATVPDAIVLCVDEADPVSGDHDLVYILTRNPAWMRRLFQVELDVRILD